MKKKRFTEGQIIGALKEHESGAKVDNICRRIGISVGTFYNWRSKYVGLEVNEAKRLKEMESENGKPTQNAFIGSLNGKFRNECLNQHWFRDMDEARREINRWRYHYNNERLHSSLKYMTPVALANKAA